MMFVVELHLDDVHEDHLVVEEQFVLYKLWTITKKDLHRENHDDRIN